MSQFLSELNLPNMVLFTLLAQTVHNQQLSLYYYLTVGHGSQRVMCGSPGLLEIGGPERQNCSQANSTDLSFLLCCSCINGPGPIVGKTVGAPNDTNNHWILHHNTLLEEKMPESFSNILDEAVKKKISWPFDCITDRRWLFGHWYLADTFSQMSKVSLSPQWKQLIAFVASDKLWVFKQKLKYEKTCSLLLVVVI